ncbi:MAG: glycosyltransferase family 2 protein [Proteobacteria bacterium]|nr:glycosyltransferase family 2 protein [Pseudomonadota bacterium]
MAAAPYLIISPLTFMSMIGLLRGSQETAEQEEVVLDEVTVDVVIPAHNEARTIALALGSLSKQTKKPRKVFVVDDASTDETVEVVKAFTALNALDLVLIERRENQGKTPALKQIARFSDADVLFVLDGDTVLISDDYIERVVIELMRIPNRASSCGFVHPLRTIDREKARSWPIIQKLLKQRPETKITYDDTRLSSISRGITNLYRDVLYYFVQNIIYQGELALFGTLVNPLGCAVAYRREYLLDLFRETEMTLGDNLTASEDIYIGFNFIDRGYHNVQVLEVVVHSMEPEAQKLPKQLYLWSSAWLQSSYYFPELLTSPFKAVKRRRARRELNKDILDDDVYIPYQEPLGRLYAQESGRPIGWAVFFALFEKITYPLIMALFIIAGWFDILGYTILFESVLFTLLLGIFGKENKLMYMGKGLLITPIRYMSIFTDIFTVGKFFADLTRPRGKEGRGWRK